MSINCRLLHQIRLIQVNHGQLRLIKVNKDMSVHPSISPSVYHIYVIFANFGLIKLIFLLLWRHFYVIYDVIYQSMNYIQFFTILKRNIDLLVARNCIFMKVDIFENLTNPLHPKKIDSGWTRVGVKPYMTFITIWRTISLSGSQTVGNRRKKCKA